LSMDWSDFHCQIVLKRTPCREVYQQCLFGGFMTRTNFWRD